MQQENKPIDGFSIDYFDDYMRIRQHWRNPLSYFFVIFGALIVGGIYSAVGEAADDYGLWVYILIAMLGLIAALLLIYTVICFFVNHTDIYISAELLEVRTKPLFWRFNVKIPIEEIEGFYSTKNKKQRSNQAYAIYKIWLVKTNGKHERLKLPAVYGVYCATIVATIENYLNMKPMQNDANHD